MHKLFLLSPLFFLLGCLPEKSHAPDQEKSSTIIHLFDGSSLDNWLITDYAGRGEIEIDSNGSLILEMGAELTGIHWKNQIELPKVNYEISLGARRSQGSDFFCGLTFPFKESHATLILGGWGGALIGISSIDDFDASENETGDAFIFEEKKWYDIKLQVTDKNLRVWIDQQKVIDCDVEGRRVGMRYGEIEMSTPLGICTYTTTGEIRDLQLRTLD